MDWSWVDIDYFICIESKYLLHTTREEDILYIMIFHELLIFFDHSLLIFRRKCSIGLSFWKIIPDFEKWRARRLYIVSIIEFIFDASILMIREYECYSIAYWLTSV